MPKKRERERKKIFDWRKVRNGEEITGNQPGTFNATLQTKIFVHGFINNALKDFIIEIKDVLLKKVNLNVVVIDWSKGIDLKAIFFQNYNYLIKWR